MTFKPLLSGKADIDKLTYPLGGSPKLDGIRAVIRDGVVYSRTFKPIRNKHVQYLFGHRAFDGLDGELIIGDPTADGCYSRTNSGVMSAEGKPDVKFYGFDDFSSPEKPFQDRLKVAKDRMHLYNTRSDVFPGECRFVFVPHNLIESREVLEIYEKAIVEMGYEGVMLRDINGRYKFGRSTQKERILLKLKRFSDSEAEIIGAVELLHNNNPGIRNEKTGVIERSTNQENMVPSGILGAFVVRDLKTGVEFEVGTGFSMEERKIYWNDYGPLVGQIIKYKYFPYGEKDKPRHPVFLGFRDESDIV